MLTRLYESARLALEKLDNAVQQELRIDPRYKFAARRTRRLVENVKMAKTKYETLAARRVPAKVAARRRRK